MLHSLVIYPVFDLQVVYAENSYAIFSQILALLW